jgi:hypothetical protein
MLCSVIGRPTPRCSHPFVSISSASAAPSKKMTVSPLLTPDWTSLKLLICLT